MYIMQRSTSYWKFDSIEELWANRAVQLRLCAYKPPGRKPSPTTFDEFAGLLDSGEEVILGHNLVNIWKCLSCKPISECEWHQKVVDTRNETSAFYEEIMHMGGHILNDSGTMAITNDELSK